MIQPNDSFDWVTARANCSPAKVLKNLEKQVKGDVELRDSLRTPQEVQERIRFAFEAGRDGSFSVVVYRDGARDPIPERLGFATFEKCADGIKVGCKARQEEKEPIVGTLTLGKDGGCCLKVEDHEYQFWQFRKLALEPIFFTLMGEFQ